MIWIALYFAVGAALAGGQAALQRDFDSDQTFTTGLLLLLAWPPTLLAIGAYYWVKALFPKKGEPCSYCRGTGIEQ